MFTGLIQAMGKVVRSDGKRLVITLPFSKVTRGESICVDGVCLTVVSKQKTAATFDVGPETRRVTTLGTLEAGELVNLERSLRVGDPVGGHWVTGHVETTGVIRSIEKAAAHHWVTVELPTALKKFVVAKGSLSIDGISLTVAALRGKNVRLMIIPHTWTHTTLSKKNIGDRVNLEPDILAKYVLKSSPRR